MQGSIEWKDCFRGINSSATTKCSNTAAADAPTRTPPCHLPRVQVQVCHSASFSLVAPSVTCAPVLASENKIS
jgi:hypothetical protein